MRELWAFIKKETWHILRDKRTVMIMLFLPVVLMILFGFAISTEINNLDVAVLIPRNTALVQKYVDKLDKNPYINLIGQINVNEIDKVFRQGKAMAVVVFPEDFDKIILERSQGRTEKTAVQIIADASNSNMGTIAVSYLTSIFFSEEIEENMPEIQMMYNPEMKSAYNFVPGIMGLIFILICSMMTSVSIVREKENGTMELLIVSPVKPINILISKMAPYFILSCINLATILLIAKFLIGVPMSGNIVSIIGVSVLYLVLSLTIGMLISTITGKQSIALIVSGMVMLTPCLLLSGLLFPIENIPKYINWLSLIIPARWYIEAIKKLMIEGAAFRAVINETLILTAMIVFNTILSLLTFKDKPA